MLQGMWSDPHSRLVLGRFTSWRLMWSTESNWYITLPCESLTDLCLLDVA